MKIRKHPFFYRCGVGLATVSAAVVLAMAASAASIARAQTPAVGGGQLEISVTDTGALVPGATVCVGINQDLNLYAQGGTDAQGRLRISPMPPLPFVITAHQGERAVQVWRSESAPEVSFLPLAAPLGTSTARCPKTIAAGPNRKLGGDIKFEGGVGFPTAGVSNPFRRPEFCFGAAGVACGQVPPGIPVTAACAAGRCTVNGGSWDHDTCCHANPGGYACDGAGSFGASSTCRASWDKAVRLTTKGLSWIRSVDFSRANSSGTVEHDKYCAPRDALVPPGDAPKCCSRSTRALTLVEQGIATAKGETLLACR
ncbi:MAG: hypothetical protein FJ145_00680 [Deltaproteobacteria bacterium]|nr:hypothetical protein [Deltaproteobacteria bacterium]